jgi:hypothetical protein
MNKKGVVWETLADVFLAGFILFIGTSVFFFLNGMHQENVNLYFNRKITALNTEDLLPMYLHAEADVGNLGDEITKAYFGETDNLETDLDALLEKVYSSKVCWELHKDNKVWIKKNNCKKEEELLSSSTYLPLPDKEVIKVSLYVKGYAK